jgi:phenylpropionate dioxygenase-like ring-hydroxylating dioxygenase large terminal subunit
MGADLSAGSIIDDQIRCPFHGWQFGPSGRCEFIPAQAAIPQCAQVRAYAVAESPAGVFIFPSSETAYPLPFFNGFRPGELVAAPPFEFAVNCPWWLVGTNGFDLQHFSASHDRRVVAPPIVDSPHPAARRIVTTFEVCGSHRRDRLTRRFAGQLVTMDVTMWSGTLAFVVARFHGARERTRPASIVGPDTDKAGAVSYGMTEICPEASAPGSRTRVRVTIFRRRRSSNRLARRQDQTQFHPGFS